MTTINVIERNHKTALQYEKYDIDGYQSKDEKWRRLEASSVSRTT